MQQTYFVKNGSVPFAKGASKMVFPVRIVDDELKNKLENFNDSVIMKRENILRMWKNKNKEQIVQKLSEISNLDEQLLFMKNLDLAAVKMDGTEQCYFPITNDSNNNNKVIVQIPIQSHESLNYLFEEIKLQHTLAKKNMMPNIYEIQIFVKLIGDAFVFLNASMETFAEFNSFDEWIDDPSSTIMCIYLLEEMCDHYEPEEITIRQTKNYVEQVSKLAKETAELGFYNTDFKHGNECPSTEMVNDELQLSNLRALDFDPKMLIRITDDLKDKAAALMFLTYLLHFYVKQDYYFFDNKDVFEKIMEHGKNKINEMGYVEIDDFINLIEDFRLPYKKIVLASYLTASGDKENIIKNQPMIPTLFIRLILKFMNINKPNNSIIGVKRKL